MPGNRKRPKVLLLKAGDVAASVRLSQGDYHRWFAEALRDEPIDWSVVELHARQQPPPQGYDALVITGSALSLLEPQPWMHRAADYVRRVAQKGLPVLGVCFGHQLLGFAFGAGVVRNPQGREMGSVEVALTEPGRVDPLFDGCPETFTAQATHEDVVAQAPPGCIILARNANTALQAIAIGPNVRGVQFHPELRPEGLAALVQSRAAKLQDEAKRRGLPAAEVIPRILQGIRPAPFGQRVLHNFFARFV